MRNGRKEIKERKVRNGRKEIKVPLKMINFPLILTQTPMIMIASWMIGGVNGDSLRDTL